MVFKGTMENDYHLYLCKDTMISVVCVKVLKSNIGFQHFSLRKRRADVRFSNRNYNPIVQPFTDYGKLFMKKRRRK